MLNRREFCLIPAGMAAGTESSSMSILDYIKDTWPKLTRRHSELATMAIDPKIHPLNGRWPVYLPAHEDSVRIEMQLRAQMTPSDYQKVDIRPLPEDIRQIREHGLLYLPKPYVVPGGRFNEMYGWDSFFIQMGLIRDGEVSLAQSMAEDLLYEIRGYGKILNANRTYYLTRSQPPLLTGMLLAVFRATSDRGWLAGSIDAIEKYYGYWTTEPHLMIETGLSRYFDLGEGPAPEVLSSELDAQGRNDYDLIRAYYRSHRITDYDVRHYYDAKTDQLTPEFYKGDRSMRESGFDPSNRFGPFNAEVVHYNPVCLNSLLYLMEKQTSEIMTIVERQQQSQEWRHRAQERAKLINFLMWDQKRGMYFDYNFTRQRVRRYPFLTTFYPLWAGIASPEQAARVVSNLPQFERPGGLQTSTRETGDQWDAPFGWAPLQWIAVRALNRYGYRAEAERISRNFLSMVLEEFLQHGGIVEKYDVVRRRADVNKELQFGYRTNEAGFGWTNAVFTALFDGLTPDDQAHLRQIDQNRSRAKKIAGIRTLEHKNQPLAL
jgi:alpha,alpha-trehalase